MYFNKQKGTIRSDGELLVEAAAAARHAHKDARYAHTASEHSSDQRGETITEEKEEVTETERRKSSIVSTRRDYTSTAKILLVGSGADEQLAGKD